LVESAQGLGSIESDVLGEPIEGPRNVSRSKGGDFLSREPVDGGDCAADERRVANQSHASLEVEPNRLRKFACEHRALPCGWSLL
jgi:hypothetical protein